MFNIFGKSKETNVSKQSDEQDAEIQQNSGIAASLLKTFLPKLLGGLKKKMPITEIIILYKDAQTGEIMASKTEKANVRISQDVKPIKLIDMLSGL